MMDAASIKWDDESAGIVWDEPAGAIPKSASLDAQRNRQLLAGIPGGSFAPDLLMGLRSPIDAGAQLLTRGMEAIAPAGSGFEQWAQQQRKSVEDYNAKAQQEYQQRYDPQNTTGSSIAQGVGASLIGGPLMSKIGPASTILGRAAQGAGFGAAQGAMTPVDMAQGDEFWSEKAKQVGIGGLTGGIASPVFDLAGRIAAPQTSAKARALMAQGVTPTPGQILGGAWKANEEKATSIPLFGEAIKAGQRRSIEEFNRSLYARALAPLGTEAVRELKDVPVGNEGIRKVGDVLSNAYDDALGKSVPNKVTPVFASALRKVMGMVPTKERNEFSDIIQREIGDKITPAGTLTPAVAKTAESELGRLAASYRGSSVTSERELSRALVQAQEELRKLVAQNNPNIAPRIQAINNGWANLTQLENAGSMLGAKDGIFTPAQFLNAVKKSDPSVRDRAFARGLARNQEIAQAADAVLSSKYPDSGTTGRALFGLGAAGGLGMVNPAIPIAGGVASLAYTPMGQRAMASMLTKRPESIRGIGSFLSDASPYLGVPLTAGLLSYQ